MTDKTLHLLNTRRLLCPLPVIRTQDKIKELQPGDLLEVTCTDPGTLHDIPAWCRVHGHSIVDTRQDDLDIIITVRVGE
jgi:tRNA 2-thiouridine synthesizing protein A